MFFFLVFCGKNMKFENYLLNLQSEVNRGETIDENLKPYK